MSIECVSQQFESEILQFLSVIVDSGYKTALEIGTGSCGTALLLLSAMGAGSLVVSVDLPESDGGTSHEAENSAKTSVSAGEYVLVRGRSTDPKTVALVVAALNGRYADLLFIDAEHTESAAMGDLSAYKGLVRRGGMIAFHDICMLELWPMWNRARGWYPPENSNEIIRERSQRCCGIGTLRVGE